MSEFINNFHSGSNTISLVLPFNLDAVSTEWDKLRNKMIRFMPPEFSREEWSYLIVFLERCRLNSIFSKTFGERVNALDAVDTVMRPKGNVALWLPNNVSLLGPLMMVLISLTGNRLVMKAGTRSENLTKVFWGYALEYLPDGALKDYLKNFVTTNLFDRTDSRNTEMSQIANVRIFFGSDAGASYIDQLPHKLDCSSIYFTDRCSEAWIDKESITEETVSDLIKVFNVYGRAGCTSPRRVVVISGDKKDALHLWDAILDMWKTVIFSKPLQHVASSNVLAKQLSTALGWKAEITPNNSSVIAVGEFGLEVPSGNMILPVTWSSMEEAVRSLPLNIQTIGHAFDYWPRFF